MNADQVDPRDQVNALPAECWPAPAELGPARPVRFVASHRRPGNPEPLLGLVGALVSSLVVAGVAAATWVWLLTTHVR